jgi:hypothetical protein
MKLADLYWMAGWYEGEGSCWNAKNGSGGGGSIVISATTTDEDVARKVAQLLGSRTRIHVWRPTEKYAAKKTQYRVRLFGAEAAGWLMTLYPLLGERRQGQVKTVLAYWRSHGRNAH